MTWASDEEARLFAASFRSFLEWVHSEDAAARNHNEVVALITDFLGPDGPAQSVVGRVLPPFEHVNLQTALDAWSAEPGRSVAVHGITIPPHYGPVSLQQLVTERASRRCGSRRHHWWICRTGRAQHWPVCCWPRC